MLIVNWCLFILPVAHTKYELKKLLIIKCSSVSLHIKIVPTFCLINIISSFLVQKQLKNTLPYFLLFRKQVKDLRRIHTIFNMPKMFFLLILNTNQFVPGNRTGRTYRPAMLIPPPATLYVCKDGPSFCSPMSCHLMCLA